MSRSFDMEPVFVTQPALYGGGPDPTTGIDFSNRRINEYGSGEHEWRFLDLYNRATRQVGAEQHVLVVDLAAELPKDSQYFYDLVHFSKLGAVKVAAIVGQHLEPWLADRVVRKNRAASKQLQE